MLLLRSLLRLERILLLLLKHRKAIKRYQKKKRRGWTINKEKERGVWFRLSVLEFWEREKKDNEQQNFLVHYEPSSSPILGKGLSLLPWISELLLDHGMLRDSLDVWFSKRLMVEEPVKKSSNDMKVSNQFEQRTTSPIPVKLCILLKQKTS